MKYRAKKASPEQIRDRMRTKLRLATLDAKRAGISTREIMEITGYAVMDWRFMNG